MKKIVICVSFIIFFMKIALTYDIFKLTKVELTNKKDFKQFVFTDRISGYFENKTFSYTSGEGYKIYNTVIFRDFISSVNQIANNRRNAQKVIIYPSWIETYFENSKETLFLVQDEQTIILEISSEKASKLGIVALVNWFMKDVTNVKVDNGVILYNSRITISKTKDPIYMGIFSDKSFSLKDSSNITSEVKISKNFGNSGLLESDENLKVIQFVLIFGTNINDILKKASEITNIENYKQKQLNKMLTRLTENYFETSQKELIDKNMWWVIYSSDGFVEEEFGRGIWAGLPWFKNNWGRDTFISLPGCTLTIGNFEDARKIIKDFAKYQDRGILNISISGDIETLKEIRKELLQKFPTVSSVIAKGELKITVPSYMFKYTFQSKDEMINKLESVKNNLGSLNISESFFKSKTYGRIPNLVNNETSVQYNTTDGTPWFVREVMDYLHYTEDLELAKEIYPVIKTFIEGAIENFVDEYGLLTHDDADTWMDARIEGKEAWSPRGNRAIEIQILWLTSLEIGIKISKIVGDDKSQKKWQELYTKARKNFVDLFWEKDKIADRIRKDGSKDFKVRPNMLMAITVPFETILGEDKEALILKNGISELLYPYGIASLSQNDEFFHPWHEKWELYHKDSAYHNGTVWIWNTGFTILSLLKFGYIELAYELFTNTLNQVLNLGCIGTLSELLDAMPLPDGKPKPSGTYSQAWSVAEITRAFYQGFLGFNPRLLENKIILSPHITYTMGNISAKFKFGKDEYLLMNVEFKKTNLVEYNLSLSNSSRNINIEFVFTDHKTGDRYIIPSKLSKKPSTLSFDTSKGISIVLNGKNLTTKNYKFEKGFKKEIGELRFLKPIVRENLEVVKQKDFLKSKILKGEWY